MTRIALLKIKNGGINQGFNVSLQVLKFTSILPQEIPGNLPYNPDVEGLYVCWQTDFRNLSGTYRNQDLRRISFKLSFLRVLRGSFFRHLYVSPRNNQNSQRGDYDDWQIESNLATNYSTSEGIEACKKLVNRLEESFKECLDSVHIPNKNLGRIRERLAIELNNKSDPIQIIIQPEKSLFYKLNWYVWDLLENNFDVGISFLQARNDLEELQPVQPRKKDRVRILAVFGDSRNIDLEPDWKEINKLIAKGAEVVPLDKPTAQEFITTLRDKQGWDILFFAGHSNQKNDTGIIYINEHESLTIKQFQNALIEARLYGLQIAIFNSCKGLGLATQLSDLQIPFIIVMQDVVPDKVAQFFLKEFLTEYAGGKALPTAVRLAQSRLETFTYLPGATWLPVMFQSYIGIAPTWQDFLLPKKGDYIESPDKLSDEQYTYIGLATPKKPKSQKPKLRVVFLISLIITSLVMWGRWQGKLQTLELAAFDFLMRQQLVIEQPQPDKRLLIVSITPQDVTRLKQPPEETGQGARTLSDRTLETLLATLQKHKPQVIGLDIFREGSVDNKYPNLQASFKNGRLIAVCFSYNEEYNRSISAPNLVPTENIGFADLLPDQDDVIRRHLLVQSLDDIQYPCRTKQVEAFSLKLAFSFLKKEEITRLDKKDDDFVQIGNVKFNPLKLHFAAYHDSDSDVEGGVQVILNYRPYQDYKKDIATVISLTDVLEDKLDPDQVKDRIVLIGVDASDDRYKTPYDQKLKLPGVFIHAQMVSYLLDVVKGKQKIIWAWPWFIDVTWVWIWSSVGGILVWIVPWKRGQEKKYLLKLLIIGGITLSILYVFCFSFLICLGAWIPLIPSAISMLITGLTVAYKVFPIKHINKSFSQVNTGKL